MSQRLPQRVLDRLRCAVEQQVLGQAGSLAAFRGSIPAVQTRLEGLEARWPALREGLDQALALARFTPRTTVERALSLHPAVAAVLAEHQLDRCERCPVRHDETLEEVARGHDIPLAQLLSRLDALIA